MANINTQTKQVLNKNEITNHTDQVFDKELAQKKIDNGITNPADQIFDKKLAQEKIADDEYTAALQKFIDRDVIATKYFNAEEITYPFMEKSGKYNIGGFQIDEGTEPSTVDKYLGQKASSYFLSKESNFQNRYKSKKAVIAITQKPISNTNDLKKIRTILHEVRHKAFSENTITAYLEENKLNEEILNLFLDIKAFPELKEKIKTEIDNQYKGGYENLSKKYGPESDNIIKFFTKKPSIKDQIFNLFK